MEALVVQEWVQPPVPTHGLMMEEQKSSWPGLFREGI